MIEFVDIEHAQELDAYVAGHEWAHTMQTSAWGRVKKDWGWTGIVCRDSDDNICGTMALLQHNIRHTGTCMLYSPRGPIFDHDNFDVFKELVDAAKKLAKERKAYLLRIDPMFEEGSDAFLNKTAKLGFTCNAASDFSLFQPRMCYVTDLQGLDAESLLASYSRIKRYDVRRAIRNGVTIRMGDEKDMPRFCEMMQLTADKNGFTARSRSYFEEFLAGLGDKARFYIAEKDGVTIAGSITMELGNRMWHMYACSDREYQASLPNELLQYRMQCDAIAAGYRWFDFRGVEGYPVEENPKFGLHHYKQGFGAQFHAYVGQLDLILRPFMGKLVKLLMKIRSR